MKKINSSGYTNFISALTKSSFLGIGTYYLLSMSRTTSFFSMLAGFILSFFVVFFVIKFISYKPNLTFQEKMKSIFGNHLGSLITVIVILCTFAAGCLTSFSLVSFLATQYLIHTPRIYLYALVMALIVYIITKDSETLSRFATIALVICVIIYLFNLISLFPTIKIDNFKPLFDITTNEFIKSSIVFSILFSGPFVFTSFLKKDDIVDKEKLNKSLIKMYIYAFITLAGIIILIIGSLGINMSIIFSYPAYMVLTKIKIFNFIDSIENIVVIYWFLHLTVSSSFMFSSVKEITIDLFKVKKDKFKNIIAVLIGVVAFALPQLLLENNYSGENHLLSYVNIPIVIYTILIFIIVISSIVSFIRKGTKNEI